VKVRTNKKTSRKELVSSFRKADFFFGLSLLAQACFPGMAGRPVRLGHCQTFGRYCEAAAERRLLAGGVALVCRQSFVTVTEHHPSF
jgi:hypothetical protein